MDSSAFQKDIIVKCSLEKMVQRFFKDYIIVWHDPNLNTEENELYMHQLERFCKIETFTKWKEASVFIRETKKICHVITSGTDGEIFTREIESNQNISSIYVFCKNKDYHSTWTKSNQKISCVETDIQNIFNNIEKNLLEWYKQESSLNLNLPAFAPIFNDTDKSHMNRLHHYLKAIPAFKNKEQAKDHFTALSKKIYSEEKDIKEILEFEENYNEYNGEGILGWYTRDSFLYKVANNCLRIATSDSIQYCRLILGDLQKAIKERYQNKSKDFSGLLYRGAYLSDGEWSSLKQNEGNEIEMHGFMSASKLKKVAVNFVRGDPLKKAFITILVPKGQNDEEQGFAEIDKVSEFSGEKEVLFNVRSRFTVLETEEIYSKELPSRHLVLLYGAQGFRKFIAEKNLAEEISIPEKISCTQCKVSSSEVPQNMLFIPILDLKNSRINELNSPTLIKSDPQFIDSPQTNNYYCKGCLPKFIECNDAPLLCVPFANDPMRKIQIKGSLLMKEHAKTPFYGYQCTNCQAKKQKVYFVCTHCEKKKSIWCENCFEKASNCLKLDHTVILESSPFSFWFEQMSEKELNHLKIQNDLVLENDTFQQGQMYFQRHEYAKAFGFYTAYLHQNQAKAPDENIIFCIQNLGEIHNSQGEYNEALEHYTTALEISFLVYGENHSGTARSYDGVSNVYFNMGQYNDALKNYLISLEIRKSLYGDTHSDIALSLHNIGKIHGILLEDEKALESHFKSLNIRRSIYGENHPSIAESYNCIGVISFRRGDYEKALEYHLKSIDIEISVYGEIHSNVADSYHQIGLVYENQDEDEKALDCLSKACDIRKSLFGEDHPALVRSYNALGKFFQKMLEWEKALEFVRKALTILTFSEGDSPEIAASLFNLGLIYGELGFSKTAIEHHLKSLKIRRSIYGENHITVADSYHNLGDLSYRKGEYENALEYYLKSVAIEISVHGENHLYVADSYNSLGMIYTNLEKYNEALDCYLKSVQIEVSFFGENHSDVASSYSNIGATYESLIEYGKALEYHLKSHDVKKSLFGEDYLRTAEAQELLYHITELKEMMI